MRKLLFCRYLVGQTIAVSSSKVGQPTTVRYAWKDTSVAVLFNLEGFPASGFVTE